MKHAAKTECEIVAQIANKKVMSDLDDAEILYRQLCASAVTRCLERHPQFSLCVDKRYTNPHLREKQNMAILKEISSLQEAILVIEHAESESESALQVADAVAWALFQKHERGDESFYRLVKDKIVIEELWETKRLAHPEGRFSPFTPKAGVKPDGVSPTYVGAARSRTYESSLITLY